MDEEKKFKLDELPEKGSSHSNPAPRQIRPVHKTSEPRLEKLKGLNSTERLEAMTQRWYFDKPVRHWTWLVLLLVLLGLQLSGNWTEFITGMASASERTGGFSDLFVGDTPFHFLFRYPLLFALLIPLFFKTQEPSKFYFEITFDGIHSVRSVMGNTPQDPPRVRLKWDEIVEVKKLMVDKRPILELHTKAGAEAQLIWDIDEVKKKVIKQVVKGLVSHKNVFRIFIEKEVT
jgi:hypothetical protein